MDSRAGEPSAPDPLCLVCGEILLNLTIKHAALASKNAKYFSHLKSQNGKQAKSMIQTNAISENALEASY